MEQSVTQKITTIQKAKNLSQAALCDACGVQRSALNMAIKNNTDVKFSTVAKILAVFPDVSAEWMMRGEGDMIKKRNDGTSITINNSKQYGSNNTVGDGNVVTNNQGSLSDDRDRLLAMIEEKDARIKELTDTIIKMALK